MTVFIREAPTEENTASKCIRMWPQHMVVKFYICMNTELTSMDMKRTVNGTPRIPAHAA